MGRGMGRGMCKGGSAIPDWLRLWEFSKLSVGSWIVAGSLGYVLCAPRPGAQSTGTSPNTAVFWWRAGIRPKWYPTIERPKATVFTPKELDEWNQGKVGPHAEVKTSN